MLNEIFNLVEGLWWIGLGVWLFFSRSLGHKHYKALITITLILFGISDFVEMTTGAWWQPWWLLVWKALCIGIGIILIVLIYIKKRRLP
jgi:hypothetical protein